MPKIKIRKSRLVPYAGRIVGTIGLTAIYGYLLNMLPEAAFIIAALVLSPILPVLWMSWNVLEINDDEKYWWTYKWILGFKIGKVNPYMELKHLRLSEVTIQPKRGPEVIRYDLVSVFDHDAELKLTQRKNLLPLRQNGEKMAEKLNIPLIDQTKDGE